LASAESRARIVRLSEVEGTVQMDRGDGDGFAKAFLNMPVIERAKLKTSNDARAEVEFEDGSVLHISSNTEIRFTHLALGDEGQKLSAVELTSGKVYVNVRGKKGDRFTLDFGRQSVTLAEPAHFRLDYGMTEATLAVFQGDVRVSGPYGEVEIGKKHSATFDLANNDSYALSKNFEEDPEDEWDRQQSEYHDRYASNHTYDPSSPYSYGMTDLNYYGNYMTVPGYGWVWQPYFVNAAWSPFQDGAWMWYPGCGYMWVSAYPWGWMPYRYGNWAFAPGYGWVWQPGYWGTWSAVPQVVNPPRRTSVLTPPVRGTGTVMVGQGLTANPAAPPQRVTINPVSAGLGVPRGSIRHLDHVAREVEKNSRAVVVPNERTTVVGAPNATGATTNAGSMGGASRGTGTTSGGTSAGTRSSPPVREAPAPRMTPMPMPAPSRSTPQVSAPPARSGNPH
jgi:hypothetical protein